MKKPITTTDAQNGEFLKMKPMRQKGKIIFRGPQFHCAECAQLRERLKRAVKAAKKMRPFVSGNTLKLADDVIADAEKERV